MADFAFNIAKGMEKYYASLPGTNDALIVVPLETTGLEVDATLKDYDNLGALLAGTTNRQTTMGDKSLTAVTATIDDTNDWTDVDFADVTWVAATGNPVGAVLVCYDPDTTAGTDTDIIPLTKHDFAVTPNGGDITAQVPTGGFLRIQ